MREYLIVDFKNSKSYAWLSVYNEAGQRLQSKPATKKEVQILTEEASMQCKKIIPLPFGWAVRLQ